MKVKIAGNEKIRKIEENLLKQVLLVSFINERDMNLFNDINTLRESNQWRTVYASPYVGEGNQIFSNFGSCSDQSELTQDIQELVNKIAQQFAIDVFSELRPDLNQAQNRSSRTSQGERDLSKKPIVLQRTPAVTPFNSRRIGRIGAVKTPKDQSRGPFVSFT